MMDPSSTSGAIRSGFDDLFERDAAAVHFVVEADHRRAAVMPGQTGMSCAAPHEFVGEKRMQVMNRVNLRRRGIAPGKAERGHAALHFAEYEACLFAKAVRAYVAEPHDAFAVAGVAFLRFGAAGDHERWCSVC